MYLMNSSLIDINYLEILYVFRLILAFNQSYLMKRGRKCGAHTQALVTCRYATFCTAGIKLISLLFPCPMLTRCVRIKRGEYLHVCFTFRELTECMTALDCRVFCGFVCVFCRKREIMKESDVDIV